MGQPEEASYLALELGADLSFRGLVLAGIIIGALGVLDDICVGQASAVFELINANRDMSWLDLFRSSLNIGRDHIAAMVNTLLLAYVGASLPLMLVFTIYTEAHAGGQPGADPGSADHRADRQPDRALGGAAGEGEA